MTRAENCTCAELHAGQHHTGSYNWSPECPLHGLKSDWWRDVGKAQQDEENAKTMEAYRKRDEARARWKREAEENNDNL